jgi:hypothetical protein
MYNDENPDSEMMDFVVHEAFDYPDAAIWIASRFTKKFGVDVI